MLASLLLAALRAQPGRTVLAVISIALGVALAVAVHTINASAVAEMDQAARMLSGTADLRIEAGRSGFDERALARTLQQPGVAAASPIIELEVRVPGAKDAAGPARTLRLLGVDALRAAWVQPALLGKPADPTDRFAWLRPQNIFLNQAALSALGTSPGQALTLAGPTGEVRVTIAGTVDADEARLPVGVMDIAAVQDAFLLHGTLTRIDLRLQAGSNRSAIAQQLQSALPLGVIVAEPAQSRSRAANLSRAYRVNLTVLALVALFTGTFLVFSMAALAVVRRRSELALLRVLGVTRRGLALALTAEGAVIGLLGGLLGVAGGLGLAHLALRIFAADLGGGFFSGLHPRVMFDAPALLLLGLLGMAAGATGALLPALEAAARPAAQALKPGDDAVLMQHRPGWRLGLVLLSLAALLLAAPPIGGLPWAGYASIALMIIGTLALLPVAMQRLTVSLPAPQSPFAQLAWQQMSAMPGYAVSGLATVIVSFSLVAAMAVMVHSFRQSLDHWLGDVLHADVYVRAPGGITARMPDELPALLTRLDGVTRADPVRYFSLLLDADQAPVTLIARPLDGVALSEMPVTRRHIGPASPGLPVIWVSEAMADLHGAEPGRTITLPLAGQSAEVFVAGIWRDYTRTWGALVIDRDAYVKLTGDAAVNEMHLRKQPGSDGTALVAAIRALPGGARMEVMQAREVADLSLTIFDRTFAITYALEFAALLVGMAGSAAHFAALAFGRRREFGMLRHLGVTRGEIGRLLALEGAVIGGIGAAIGLALGFAISLILIHVVNRQSFHWGMELHVPWLTLAALGAALLVLAALSARISGRFAMSRAAVLAVKEDA